MSEKYTLQVLKQHLNIHRKYLNRLDKLSNRYNVSFRKPIFPEAISENIIKHIIHKKYRYNVTWDCSGDLFSSEIGKIECKAFASDGPISFGHNQNWNIIYFLDLNDWYLNNNVKLYELKIKNNSTIWLNVQINKNETIQNIYLKKQRAKISWKNLYPQIQKYVDIVYDGNINNILFYSNTYNIIVNVIYFPIKCITKIISFCSKTKRN
jgi:hypothetical protein